MGHHADLLDGPKVAVASTLPPPVAPAAPLTDREQVVLGFLAGELSTRQIADELYVSVNTNKSHLRSIYRKLDTSRRGEAVSRARHLRLL
jgi:LuxR family maltose regulon positive regulatory protein